MIVLPKRHKLPIDAQINIVPYIDVMLVLLVIFMMTTPIIEQGIEVDLPNAKSKMVEFSQQQPTIITIDAKGDYFINSIEDESAETNTGERLPLHIIGGRVIARLETFPQMKIFVRGDKTVDYGTVIALMDYLQNQASVDKVGIITESPDI